MLASAHAPAEGFADCALGGDELAQSRERMIPGAITFQLSEKRQGWSERNSARRNLVGDRRIRRANAEEAAHLVEGERRRDLSMHCRRDEW